MKILIIEDDQHKSKQINSYINDYAPNTKVIVKKSYQSGLKELIINKHEIILLDMQLPNFDIKSGDDGYKFRKLAGFDILNEIKRKKVICKVIIITQFETFGEGEKYIELKDLRQLLKEQFQGIYLDTVYYSPKNSVWQKELKALLIKNFKDLC